MSRLAKSFVRWTVYQDRRGKWRWKCIAANYRTSNASEQGFKSRRYAVADAIKDGAPRALQTHDTFDVEAA